MPLVHAGWILTCAQAGGVCGRLFWGWLADRRRDALTVLAWLSATLVAATAAIGTLVFGWPTPLIYALFFILGTTASGWNGAFLGEVARAAPPGQVSPATAIATRATVAAMRLATAGTLGAPRAARVIGS